MEVSCGGFVDEGFCQGRRSKEGSGEVGHICGRFGDGKTSRKRLTKNFPHWPSRR